MAIQTLQDTGGSYLVDPSYDGAVYRLVSDDCVIKGIGDEFTLNSNGLNILFSSGSQCLIDGNYFRIISDTLITLDANSTIYLTCRIDTSKPNGSKGSIEKLTEVQITYGNINGGDNVRDMLLYVITTDATSIINVVDKRIIKELGSRNILTKKLTAGSTSLTINHSSIKTNSVVSAFTSVYGIEPSNIVVNNGNVVLTFSPQTTDVLVGVKIEGTY